MFLKTKHEEMKVCQYLTLTVHRKKEVQCTYTTFCSNEDHATPECPILVLDNQNRKWNHHSCGVFTNQNKQTAFEFDEKDGTCSADILKVDVRDLLIPNKM